MTTADFNYNYRALLPYTVKDYEKISFRIFLLLYYFLFMQKPKPTPLKFSITKHIIGIQNKNYFTDTF